MFRKKLWMLTALVTASLLASCSGNGENSATTEHTISIRLSGENVIMLTKSVQVRVRVLKDKEDKGFTFTSDNDNIEVKKDEENEGYLTVTAKKTGTSVLTVTSVADPGVSQTMEFTLVPLTDPKLTITAKDNVTSTKDNDTTGVSLTAKLEDFPYEVEYNWKSLYGKGSFTDLKDHKSTNTYLGNTFGEDEIQVSVEINGITYAATYSIYVYADHSDWTAISTAGDVKEKLLKDENVDGEFYLTNDIDLGGYEIPGRASSVFQGKLDGNGYTISNFSLKGQVATDADGNVDTAAGSKLCGFFTAVAGGALIGNIGFDNAKINQAGSGWGGAVLTSECAGTLENVFIGACHTYNNYFITNQDWFPFNAALVGVMKEGSVYRNIVVNDTSTERGTMFADVAYPAGGLNDSGTENEQTFTITNFYTNSETVGGSCWEWGGPVKDQSTYHSRLNWTSTKASTYSDLSGVVWNIADNTMPSLKKVSE